MLKRAGRSECGLGALPLLLIVAAIAIAGFFTYRWWTGEERVVKQRLDDLAVVLSPPPDGEHIMGTRMADVRRFFAPDVRISFDAEQMGSRDELETLLDRWQPPKNGFSLSFVDVVVHMIDAATAHVSLTAEVAARNAAPSEPLLDVREGTLTMKKIDAEWVIMVVESSRTLLR